MGWKDICEACGIRSKSTMKKKAKKYKMPLVTLDGHPTISKEALLLWLKKM
jgi:hypothetical protein